MASSIASLSKISDSKHSPGDDVEEKSVDIEKSPISTKAADDDRFTGDDSDFGGTEARKRLERKLLWKLDLRMSILVVIYVLNYIDRNNAGAARLRGFSTDLHLQGQEFATLLSILYVGYILMQIPSSDSRVYAGRNMILNHLGKPSIQLPVCMVVWGVISILTGITNNFVGALLTRFFLGFVEAAFFPGALFLLSKWYTRAELGSRTAILYTGNIASNAFGALLASGILDGMQGKLGRAAWRWLFYIEGALTVTVALCAIVVLPDFPATTRGWRGRWLSEEERRLAMRRMEEDAGGDERGVNAPVEEGESRGLREAVCDWKVWWLAVAMTAQVVCLSFNAYFPTLSATMGFGPTVSLLLCAPPFICAAALAFLISKHSDKTHERFLHINVSFFFGIVGFVIAICTMNTAARYVSLFLMAQCYAGFVVMYAWVSNTFARPPAKRAVALALVNAFSQLGNVAGSYVWPSNWGPTYRNSYAICISTAGCSIAMCYVMRQHLAAENRRMDAEDEVSGVKDKRFRYWL
ncbi:hypothetical protein EIP86_010164 [Pleurotus ostreatoroseus]|nr:hypothetical protein EIP86_010164 [Pleurotus ostreatoroseus]